MYGMNIKINYISNLVEMCVYVILSLLKASWL